MIASRQVSATAAAAWICWTAGTTLVAAGVMLANVCVLGCGTWLSCIGGVLLIRRWFTVALEDQRNAFELGRDYAQSRDYAHHR